MILTGPVYERDIMSVSARVYCARRLFVLKALNTLRAQGLMFSTDFPLSILPHKLRLVLKTGAHNSFPSSLVATVR